MLGTFSFSSVSSRFRAGIGRLRGAVAGRKGAEDEPVVETSGVAGASLNQDEFEAKTIETEDDQKVTIFVATEPVYSDIMEDFAPNVIGSAKQEDVEDAPAEPVRRERIVAAEPADLFINALKKPVRQKFDTSAPFIKKKAVAEVPVIEVAPVVEEVIETPVADVPAVEEIVPTIENVTVEVPVADETEIVTITDDRTPEVTVKDVEEVPVVAGVEVAEYVIETPVADVPVVAEAAEPTFEVDETFLETLESEESKIECEIAHDADDDAVAQFSEQTVIPVLPKKFDVIELEPIEAESDVAEVVDSEPEFAMTSAEAIEAVAEVSSINTVLVVEEIVKIEDESEAILAFRSELSDDALEFSNTSYDDNKAFREDYLDRTERTFKIRASSLRTQPRFDGNFRSLSRY